MSAFPGADAQTILASPDYDYISGPKDWKLLRSRLKAFSEASALGVDTETTGLNPRADQVRLIQVSDGYSAVLVDLNGWRESGRREVPWDAPGLQDLLILLESNRPKVLHNAAFDLNMLMGEGVHLKGPFFDTMIAAKIINNGTGFKNDLGSVTARVLKVELPKELQKAPWADTVTTEMKIYAARDAIVLPRLAELLSDMLKRSVVWEGRTLWHIMRMEMECLEPIALMQWHGIGFNPEAAQALRAELVREADQKLRPYLEMLEQRLRARGLELPKEPDGSFNTREKTSGSVKKGTKVYAGYNPRSRTQTAKWWAAAGIVLPPNENGKPSMDQNLLAFLRADEPLVNAFLEWTEVMTAVSQVDTLLKHVGDDFRIHGSYRQVGTDTGRLSAAEPNLQQIKRDTRFRELFVAALGYKIVGADFSQIELRLGAELSGEPRMIEAYKAGRDLHTETAVTVSGKPIEEVTKADRTAAKICNFGLLYGAGAATLRKQAMAQYGVSLTHKEAQHLVAAFRAAYPRLKQWQDEEGNKTTKAVFTKVGRRRILIGFNDKYTTRVNTPVQGTAGDIAKLAIGKLWRELQLRPFSEVRLIAMVHDELLLEVREDLAEHWGKRLAACMESAGNSVCEHVPIVADPAIGNTWAEAK